MTEKEIEIVMNALAGTPTVTTAEFADKVERILKNSLVSQKESMERNNSLPG